VQLEEAIVCTFSEAKTGKVIVEYVVKGRWYEQCTRLGDTDDGAVTSKRLCHSVRRSSCWDFGNTVLTYKFRGSNSKILRNQSAYTCDVKHWSWIHDACSLICSTVKRNMSSIIMCVLWHAVSGAQYVLHYNVLSLYSLILHAPWAFFIADINEIVWKIRITDITLHSQKLCFHGRISLNVLYYTLCARFVNYEPILWKIIVIWDSYSVGMMTNTKSN
jgi:hypothetical protein